MLPFRHRGKVVGALPWWKDMMGGTAVGGPRIRWQVLKTLARRWLCRVLQRWARSGVQWCTPDSVREMGASGICSRAERKET